MVPLSLLSFYNEWFRKAAVFNLFEKTIIVKFLRARRRRFRLPRRQILEHAANAGRARVRHNWHQIQIIVIPLFGTRPLVELQELHKPGDGSFLLGSEEVERFDITLEKIFD